MGRRIYDLEARKDVNARMMVDIDYLACYLNDENDIYVGGAMIAKNGYHDSKDKELIVKGDIVDKDGNILYILRSFGNIYLEDSGYYGFELSCKALERFTDVSSIAGVRVYVIKKNIL